MQVKGAIIVTVLLFTTYSKSVSCEAMDIVTQCQPRPGEANPRIDDLRDWTGCCEVICTVSGRNYFLKMGSWLPHLAVHSYCSDEGDHAAMPGTESANDFWCNYLNAEPYIHKLITSVCPRDKDEFDLTSSTCVVRGTAVRPCGHHLRNCEGYCK